MLDISVLNSDVIGDLICRGHSKEQIHEMTPDEAFDEYCEWQGLIRWGTHLRAVMKQLADAEVESPGAGF
jgi:hypothetical protein